MAEFDQNLEAYVLTREDEQAKHAIVAGDNLGDYFGYDRVQNIILAERAHAQHLIEATADIALSTVTVLPVSDIAQVSVVNAKPPAEKLTWRHVRGDPDSLEPMIADNITAAYQELVHYLEGLHSDVPSYRYAFEAIKRRLEEKGNQDDMAKVKHLETVWQSALRISAYQKRNFGEFEWQYE